MGNGSPEVDAFGVVNLSENRGGNNLTTSGRNRCVNFRFPYREIFAFFNDNLLNVDIVAPHVGLPMLLHSPSGLRYLPGLQATLDKHDGHTFRMSVLDVSIIGKNLFTSSALKSYLKIPSPVKYRSSSHTHLTRNIQTFYPLRTFSKTNKIVYRGKKKSAI